MKPTVWLLPLIGIISLAATSLIDAQEACPDDPSCTEVAYGLPEADIAAYPAPDVVQLYPNDSDLYDRIYRRVDGPVDIFDAPNGAVTASLGAGFDFVTVQSVQGDWAEISLNQWVKQEHLTDDVLVSRYAGVELPDTALRYPMGWLLRHVRPSQTPGVDPSPDTPVLLRYTKVNLYTSVEIDGFKWYQIGVDQWIHQYNVATIIPLERPAEIDTERWVSVDLYEQVAIAYEGTKPVFATLVSSGMRDWPTNEGLFHVYVRYPRTVMSGADGLPDFYYLEEVPWTMYFDDDIALHGTYWHDGFGYRHSHGCVNLSITDAKWLYDWASPEFDYTVSNDLGPAVYVYSSGQYK